mmetsp:Transcript_10032/g.23533  ORF Transcript_10032/g.23533 Transcript_10032/m.23533 type:complete len:132 (+) Transcript_10032:236-631(+)
MWDVGAREPELWRHYMPSTSAVIYMLRGFQDELQQELENFKYIMAEKDWEKVPVLFLVNRTSKGSDKPQAELGEVWAALEEQFGEGLNGATCLGMQECDCIANTGLTEVLQWLGEPTSEAPTLGGLTKGAR